VTSEDFDPLAQKSQADALLEEAALHLRQLLRQAVSHLDPFPPFPGAFFTYAIEVEPAVARSERGCVVVCPDGELYELVMGMELPPYPGEPADPVSMRKEELRRLDDLHPRDYLVYAYNALTRVVELLLEQQEEKGS
jgi:hypothetical protein